MATRKEFCDEMITVYENHGVYIGTGNGELTEELTIGKIRQMEVNYGYDRDRTNTNIRRDLAYIGKCYERGWGMSKSRSGDCSGQVVGCLRRLNVISEKADYSCKTFMKASIPVQIKDLKPADLVFNKESEPSHMGVYVGDGYVIESKGRDEGVVKRNINDGSWAIGGRLDWFDDSGDIPPLTRNLYYREGDLMRGEDVRMCQEQLTSAGYGCGSIDGVFGKKTKVAVQAFQLENDLTPDGVVGQKTWAKLWE